MKSTRYLVAAVVIMLFSTSSADTQEGETARQQRAGFETIIEGLNKDSFEGFTRAIDKKAMTARIFGNRLIDADVRTAFSRDFSVSLQQMFVASFPVSDKEILGTLIDFESDGERGRAVVRYAASGYRYAYHVYELRFDPKGRVSIEDWVDYYGGSRFSDEVGLSLVMALPSKAAALRELDNKGLDDREVFQVAELFKAVRDKNSERFFQITDGMRDTVLKEKLISRLALRMALMARDTARIDSAARLLAESNANDALNSLRLIEYLIPRRQYQSAIDELVRLQADIGVRDGALESLKASAALANGDTAEALAFAREAATAEPGLELSWWTLLRAGTRVENFAAVTEALTRLEDDFGHRLGPATLKRDPFLKVLADRQEYLDWRASRD